MNTPDYGTAMPYVAILDGGGRAIRDTLSGIPLGQFVTSFEYTYVEPNGDDDEDELIDHGQFTIETNNPDLLGMASLKSYMPLTLQWGYITPDYKVIASQPRKVLITSHKANFDSTGVHITIEFKDHGILLMNTPVSAAAKNLPFAKFWIELAKGNFLDMALVDYQANEELTTEEILAVKVDEALYPTQGSGVATSFNNYGDVINAATSQIQNTSYQYYDGTLIFRVRKNYVEQDMAYIQDLVEKDGTRFALSRFGFETVESAAVVQGNPLNMYQEYWAIANGMGGNGPYYVSTRDGKVELHNKKVNRPITKEYIYAGGSGELLSFSLDIDFTEEAKDGITTEEIDPVTGQTKTTIQQILSRNRENKDQNYQLVNWNWLNNPRGGGEVNQERIKAQQGTGYSVSVPEHDYTGPKKVEDQIFKASGIKGTPDYKSARQNATEWVNSHQDITMEQFNKYWSDFRSMVMSKIKPSDIDSKEKLGYAASEVMRTGELFLEFEVTLQERVYPSMYATDTDLLERNLPRANEDIGGGSSPLTAKQPTSTEEWRNQVASGDISLYTDADLYTQMRNVGKGYGDQSRVEQGVSNLKAIPGFVSITSDGYDWIDTGEAAEGYNPKQSNNHAAVAAYLYTHKVKVRLPMDGVSIVKKYGILGPGVTNLTKNDLLNSQDRAIKGNATVLGYPTMESSMNLLIKNVSRPYSGVWYTKKVTHRINSSGYICDIEFNLRNIEIQVGQVGVNYDNLVAEVNAANQDIKRWAEWSEKTGAHKRQEAIVEFAIAMFNRANRGFNTYVDANTGQTLFYKGETPYNHTPSDIPTIPDSQK